MISPQQQGMYLRRLKDRSTNRIHRGGGEQEGQEREEASNLVGALCSEFWQKRKRTSFKDFVKAYLLDMTSEVKWSWSLIVSSRRGELCRCSNSDKAKRMKIGEISSY